MKNLLTLFVLLILLFSCSKNSVEPEPILSNTVIGETTFINEFNYENNPYTQIQFKVVNSFDTTKVKINERYFYTFDKHQLNISIGDLFNFIFIDDNDGDWIIELK